MHLTSQVGTSTAVVFVAYNMYGQLAVAERVISIIEFCDEGLINCDGACSEVRRFTFGACSLPPHVYRAMSPT